MDVTDYLDLVAYIDKMECGAELSDVYKSKFDDSYITHVGLEDDVKFLAERGITEQLMHGVGFSPKDSKWYGWSHRAIYGFEVGSTCEPGNCHYVADTPEGLIDDYANFFADISAECAEQHRAQCQILPDRSGIRILHTPLKIPAVKNVEELTTALDGDLSELPEEDIYKDSYQLIKCGRGRWVAETLEDAKQMAIDFNEGVS